VLDNEHQLKPLYDEQDGWSVMVEKHVATRQEPGDLVRLRQIFSVAARWRTLILRNEYRYIGNSTAHEGDL